MKKVKVTLAISVAFLTIGGLQAAQVTWGAAQSNGIGDASGNPLPNGSGDLMLIGNFNISNAMIAANGSNESFLMSHFILFASSTIGAGEPNGAGSASDGYWLANSVGSTTILAIQHTEIYYWLFNAPTAAAATQYGIFTNPAAATYPGSWSFPADTDIPSVTVTDLSDVPHDSSGILWGGYGTGISRDDVSPLFDLASFTAVPEPSTFALFGLGGMISFGLIRRRAKR